MSKINIDEELFGLLEKQLYTAVVSDVLDSLGFRDQVMRANLNPLVGGSVVAGRARTLLAVDYYEPLSNPYAKEMEFIGTLNPGDMVVAATNESQQNGLWGELLSTAAKVRGARGAIIDGYVRDVRKIKNLGFPLWCTGTKPVDSAGRGLTIAYDCTVKCGDVLVRSGDIVFADEDGVVVIPSHIVREVVHHALEKVEAEDGTRAALFEGVPLRDVFAKYRVL
ncbi:MAG: RraA family protein [Firmicutes bacterium]|nr:RraA family protein [Bacillota bacterium]